MVSVFPHLALCLALGAPAQAPPPAHPSGTLLIVLSDSGRQQDGRPVVVRTDAPRHLDVLGSGYSGRVLRLFQMAQRFAHPERTPQPGYLVLSDNQGGFPKTGFVLDGAVHPDTTFVDLHRRGDVTGRPGAMDQIFPHELMHIVVAELAGEAPEGHASQVHAVGVRTDRITAFNEGFAEHAQVMAIDDPGARPETRAIASDKAMRERADRQFAAFERAVSARWAIAPKARMAFLLWFSRAEQVMRYHGVKENLFAREPEVAARLLTARGAYNAYLIEHVMPGRPDRPAKPAARLLMTEGFVSALFYRFVNDPAIRGVWRDAGFYERFGASRTQLDPLDNAYLKVFAAVAKGGYDAAAVIDAYATLFPDEAAVARGVLRATLLGQDVPRSPQVWLLNERFTAGTTLFDQYRALPRPHTFDLNAASPADLAGVPEVDRGLAVAIASAGPYQSVEDLSRVPGMTPRALGIFRQMRSAMEAPPRPGTEHEGSLSIASIVAPYGWRALRVWLVCAVVAALCYVAVRPTRWWRAALNGLGAALAALLAGWILDSGNGLLALAAPIAVFGPGAALVTLWRTRSWRAARTVLAAWVVASLPGAAAVVPL